MEKTFSDSHYDLKHLASVIILNFSHIEMRIKSSQYKYKCIKKKLFKARASQHFKYLQTKVTKDPCAGSLPFRNWVCLVGWKIAYTIIVV